LPQGRRQNGPIPVPGLRWPLANHDEARDAFATLVTRGSTFRLLAIKGESETGKTHLTTQFFTNAQRRVPGCVCGRFDFKGTADLHASLADFVHHLQVPLPPTSNLPERLGAVLRSLAQQQRPTLLIFDAYEHAGETDRWVREMLLTSLHRYSWLRVVLAGKNVPDCHGKSWEEDSVVLTLTPPSPTHWHAWGVENRRTASLAFVKKAHALCHGKGSTLAGLLGPHA
jgi:hypothetical protein